MSSAKGGDLLDIIAIVYSEKGTLMSSIYST